MSFSQRREYLFLYSVKDANPNGNPLEENHPRYDEDTQQAMASDVRIKRTVRDEWIRQGQNVLIDGEAKSLKTRFEELMKITGLKVEKEVLQRCLDVRLFGVTFALGKQASQEAFAWTGPVQFKWARSLHAATFEFVQGTSAFATEGKDGDKQQRSFRNEYKVPFALMAVYGLANQHAAKFTGATDEDLQAMFEGLWEGTNNLLTRSKMEHKSRLAIEIIFKEGFNGKIGGLDEKIHLLSAGGSSLTMDRQKAIRNLNEVILDIGPLLDAVAGKQEQIDGVRVMADPELTIKGEDQLRELAFVKFEVG